MWQINDLTVLERCKQTPGYYHVFCISFCFSFGLGGGLSTAFCCWQENLNCLPEILTVEGLI